MTKELIEYAKKAKGRLDNCEIPNDVGMVIDGQYYAPIQKDYIIEFKDMFMSKAIKKDKP